MKFYVCMHNKWNPYSDEVKNIPFVYWILAFNFIQVQQNHDWKNFMLPHAEMVGQLTHPEIYKEYDREKKKRETLNKTKEGEDFYKESASGIEGGGVATVRYDPVKGLVNEEGTIIIPKERYDEMLGLDGIAISL